MFQIVEVDDIVRIPPSRFGDPLKRVAEQTLKGKYESTLSPELGYIILIIGVKADKTGKIIPGDGATYHSVTFSMLTFLPKIQELVEGEVVEITDFGAFIRVGPTDALLHLSQITDDYLTSDVKQGVINASQSKKTIKVGSRMRVRITAVSLGRGASMGKIGVTCRQPYLGAVDWIEADVEKLKQDAKKPVAKKDAKKPVAKKDAKKAKSSSKK